MQRHISVYAEVEIDEHVVHATMPPVRRALPWRVRQQNLAYRLAERAGAPTPASAERGSAPRSQANAHFSFGDQQAEYFFDGREFEDAFVGTFFQDESRGDDDDGCR